MNVTRTVDIKARRFSLKYSSLGKLQKVFALLLLGALVLFGLVAIYTDVVGRQRTRSYSYTHWGKPTLFKWVNSSIKQRYSESWRTGFTAQPWKAQYMGQANLHVFEDWCGSTTDDLRKNVHYPLHPHIRTTVKKLAVAPEQTNYGLRIFGYLHPATDGEYVFALSSDDNSDFWLSTDESPLNLQLLAWIGKTGAEWTAPGEYEKFIHQTSMPIRLSAKTKYFFEVILKQNKIGIDHVAVAWRQLDQAKDFVIIESEHISLYVNESSMVLGDIEHIPQTVASHTQSNVTKQSSVADMQTEDPRDTFYHVPLINHTFLNGILPDCFYNPSYTLRGHRLQRYQGLNFVHLSYIYPNDHTRLTHMDTDNTCYYTYKPYYFSKYMVTDKTDAAVKEDSFGKNGQIMNHEPRFVNEEAQADLEEIRDNVLFPSYEDEYDRSPVIDRGLKILSLDNNNDTDQVNVLQQDTEYDKGKNVLVNPKPKLTQARNVVDRGELQAKKRPLQPSDKLDSKKTEKSNKMQKAPQPAPQRLLTLGDVLESKSSKNIRNLNFPSGKVDEWERAIEANMPLPAFNNEQQNPKTKWTQTFKINGKDYRAQKSHTLNMNCRLTGNMLLQEVEVQTIVEGFMEKINEKHSGLFTLERVVNVVMNADAVNGKRYLVELELNDQTGNLLRLSHYIYSLKSTKATLNQPKLCNPVGFKWNPQATVHFIIPVKNQAKWIHLLISDVEKLLKETSDDNFNLILTDFSSTDMNIEQALAKSKITRYQYKKLSGNFERSRGLQEGIQLIDDPHSIVFLFDLHIRFPSSIVDVIRKHSVEGYQAFAPIVMRLDCGASPLDAKGFWEVQGFGLLGIYKSDLDVVGGMNTKEFKDRWGGEDWELLDRILQAGLEVERFYIRNFYHHFHSKHGMWLANKG